MDVLNSKRGPPPTLTLAGGTGHDEECRREMRGAEDMERGGNSVIIPLVLLLMKTFLRRIGCDRTGLDQDGNII